MCKHAICGELARKCSFLCCRVQQEQAKSCTLNKQNKSNPLSSSLSNRRALLGVYVTGEKKCILSSIITAMFGNLLYYCRKLTVSLPFINFQ